MSNRPVMLYLKPHHSHKAMGEAIDAEFIELDRGSPLSRIRTAAQMDIGDRPVITEGGKPLFQAAWMKIFGNCGPVIHLAADETLANITKKLPYYRQIDRVAHYWAHRHVDGVLAISPQLTAEARAIGVDNVRTIHPFPTAEMWDSLTKLTPDSDSDRVLVVGSNAPKNGLDILQSVADEVERDVQIDVVGPNTDQIDSRDVTGHGFVSEDRLFDFYRNSGAFLLPARSQAFALSPIEAMCAGIPPVVTVQTGCQAYVGKVAPELVAARTPSCLAESLEWALDGPDIEDRLACMAKFFDPEGSLDLFEKAYRQLLKQATAE